MRLEHTMHFARSVADRYQDVLYVDTTLLSIAVSVCFLVVAVVRCWFLRSQPKVIYGETMGIQKLLAILVYVAFQIPLVVIWARNTQSNSEISAVSAGLSIACGGPMLYLSYLEHHRCFRPSTLIVLYLSLLSVSDLTRTCALWVLYGVTRPSILMTISTVLGFALVGLESWGKSRHIPDKHEGKDRPEMFSGIVNRAVYFWLRGLLHIGARGRLELDQLFALDEEMASAGLHKAFEKEYLKRKRDCRFPSIWTLAIVLRRPILATALPRLVMLGLSVSQPILTERLLRYLDPTVHTSQVSIGSGLIGAYALQYLGLAISTSLFYQLHFRVISMVRGCLVSALNAKMGHLDMTLMENANASVTLMSTDMQQINIGLQRFHDLWANILQVAIASYLLEKQVGIACVFPIVIVACCAVASICTSSWSKTRQDQWMKKVETRISATSSLLSAVKEIKMKGLLPGGTSRIQDLRTAELRSANRFRLTIVWSLILAYIPNFLSPVMTFLVFILQAQAKDTRFDATRAFTSLSILIILTQPLAATLQGVPLLAAAVGSLGRVDAFLRAQCPVDIRSFPLQGPQTMTAASKPAMAVDVQGSGIELQETIKKDERVVNFHNVVFQTFNANLSWDDKHDVLCNVSISIPRGHLTCIVGPVASGKTSLCRALLGEGQCRQGTVCMYSDSTDVAFCSQTPWLTNSSIRQNIIGFSDGFDADWYSAVLKACGLYADLKTMVASDQTIVGNDGTAISGGQRQRVCLARAIYSRRSVLILDDILSGLDKHTARHVFHHAIGPAGLARKMGATVVYASHPGSYLTYADHVIMLGTDDKIPKEGNLKELDLDIEDSTDEERTTVTQGDLSHIELSTETTTSGQAVTLEDSEPPPADGSVHAFYFRSAGFWILFVLLVATGVQTASTVFATYWIRLWTANADGNDMFYWGIYCSIQCIGLIFLAGAAYQAVVVLITKSGSVLHQVLLTTVSHAQLAVLGATDSGKILNHFSQDIELIDRDLPFSLINTLLNVLTASGQSILIITIFPWSGIAIAGCLILLYALQKFYIRTSRQLRLLDLEAKSPLYSNYTDTLKGMSTLRAYGWLDKNFEVAQQLLDRSQRPAYLLLMVQQWLNFVLNMIVACVAVIIASIAVLQKSQQGTTGVALTLIMSIATMLQQALRAWTLFEISLGAISRIKMFQEHTPKERQTHSVNPPPDWPLHGQIELDNVVAAYSVDTYNTALNNISLKIEPGEKIGLCGKSGCGKSTLIQSLLGLLDVRGGQLVVDGLNLDEIDPDVTRARFNTIPQDSTAALGTVRENLDPYGNRSDRDLVQALVKVSLDHLMGTKLSLGSVFEPKELSGGERQLFALAAAILRGSKVVLIDEATSQVDSETEDRMQEIIRTEFKSSTVVAIAHRLEGLLSFDRIVWLEKGRIIEMDTPQALMERDSYFRRMLAQSMK